MNPVVEEDQGAFTLSAFLGQAGPGGLLAVLVGIAVLVLAVRHGRRRGPTGSALALFAASWLTFVPALHFADVSVLHHFLALTLRWSDPGADRIAPYLKLEPAPLLVEHACSIGLFLALVGSVFALARSRPATPAAAPR